MLIVDQLKRNDPPLRALSHVVLIGLLVLLVGLWWVQVVSARNYQARLETQSFRTVRVPAVRGKILDRNGIALAENRPSFNVGLYLEELRRTFDTAGADAIRRQRTNLNLLAARTEQQLNRKLTTEEKRRFKLSTAARNELRRKARALVASNLVTEISLRLEEPQTFNEANFQRHYETRLALPYPVLGNLNATQVARFEEQSLAPLGADLDIQSLRVYPLHATAAHVLGYLTRDDRSYEGEEAFFSYRLPDYRGVVGIEAGFDAQLRGRAGAKSVLVNNLGYKQSENIWTEAEPGQNVVLTLDVRLQLAAEHALLQAGARARGAAVIMDVRNGDILAMASIPAPNPDFFVQGFPPGEWDKLNDEDMRPQINRATQENYAPGSIFKTVVALACLESGLNPNASYRVQPDPANPAKGCIFVGREKKRDTAPPGDYNFRRALLRSSNAYYQAGPEAASGRARESAHLAGNRRRFPGPRTRYLQSLAGRRHRQHLHGTGTDCRHAAADGGADLRHRQRRDGLLAAARGPAGAAGSNARPAIHPLSCGSRARPSGRPRYQPAGIA